jgi:hypothetical protein
MQNYVAKGETHSVRNGNIVKLDIGKGFVGKKDIEKGHV